MNENIARYLYILISIILGICYLTISVGIYIIQPTLLHILTTIVHIFVCIFLILRFHPFSTQGLRPLDRTIIFSSACILLTNTIPAILGNKESIAPEQT